MACLCNKISACKRKLTVSIKKNRKSLLKITSDVHFWLSLRGFGALCAIVLLVTIAYAWIIHATFGKFDAAGTFGDSFGALTSLFSALAFAGLIFTLFIQKNELSLQRQEFENLVAEQKSSNEILKNQSESLYKQNFETTFFNLMAQFRSIRGEATYGPDHAKRTGQKAIEAFSNIAMDKVTRQEITDPTEAYLKFYDTFENDLGPYFRILFSTFKFIDESQIENKKFYTNILRAQLSSREAQLLMMNCASPMGREKFLPLVKEYDLLKHFSPNPEMNSNAGRYYAKIYEGSSFLEGVYLGVEVEQS